MFFRAIFFASARSQVQVQVSNASVKFKCKCQVQVSIRLVAGGLVLVDLKRYSDAIVNSGIVQISVSVLNNNYK